MKYLLLFLFILTVSCSASQRIAWDKMKSDDVRHVGTKSIESKIENATYYFTLTVFSGKSENDFCLLISSTSKLEDKGIVLLKLGNNETIRLTADNTRVGEVDWPKYIPIIGGPPYGVVTTQKVNYYTSIFDLPVEDMSKIEQNGVYKIRIQYGDSYRERSWGLDKLGVFIKEAHKTLEKRLQKPGLSYKSIDKDF